MSGVEDFMDEDYGEDKAIKMSLKKNRHILEEMFDDEDDSDESHEEEDEEEDSEEGEEYIYI